MTCKIHGGPFIVTASGALGTQSDPGSTRSSLRDGPNLHGKRCPTEELNGIITLPVTRDNDVCATSDVSGVPNRRRMGFPHSQSVSGRYAVQ